MCLEENIPTLLLEQWNIQVLSKRYIVGLGDAMVIVISSDFYFIRHLDVFSPPLLSFLDPHHHPLIPPLLNFSSRLYARTYTFHRSDLGRKWVGRTMPPVPFSCCIECVPQVRVVMTSLHTPPLTTPSLHFLSHHIPSSSSPWLPCHASLTSRNNSCPVLLVICLHPVEMHPCLQVPLDRISSSKILPTDGR